MNLLMAVGILFLLACAPKKQAVEAPVQIDPYEAIEFELTEEEIEDLPEAADSAQPEEGEDPE